MNLNEKLNNYKIELENTIEKMNYIKQEIQKLDTQGQELVAKANVLSGKIEAIEDLIKEEVSNETDNT